MKKTVFAMAGSLLALGAATLAANAQGRLPATIPTADGDQIIVRGDSRGSGNGEVRLCLQTRQGMWKKDIRIEGVGVLRSENGTTDCLLVPPGFVRLEMIKAKAFGVMTGVGYGSLDLTGWGDGTVTILWGND